MKRLAFALALALFAAPLHAATTTRTFTLFTDHYVSLGAGPLDLTALGGDVFYQEADTEPSTVMVGHLQKSGDPRSQIQTTSLVWALAKNAGASALVSAGTGITSGGGGGGGGAVTQLTTPWVTAQAGSTGTDASANQPTLPVVGANFAASGPYASYVLIKTVAANTARLKLEIMNTSGAQIAVILDDGTAAGAAAPVNASVFGMAGGLVIGAVASDWVSTTFKGRAQIYAAASSASVFAHQD